MPPMPRLPVLLFLAAVSLRPSAQAAAPEAQTPSPDAEGCTWVESVGTVGVLDRDHPYQAEAAAQQLARDAAMQRFLGRRVSLRHTIFAQAELGRQPALIEDMLKTNKSGRILKEEVVGKGYRSLPGCVDCRYTLRLRACLVPESLDTDKGFSVDLQISRELFYEGDAAALEVVATRDCYLYLYDVGANGETSLIVPNVNIPEQRLKAGVVWRYPGENAKELGLDLKAQLPSSRPPVSAETIRVVATKVALPARTADPKDGGYFGVMRRMISSNVAWAEDARQFTIYERR